jgi:hypothetical protein
MTATEQKKSEAEMLLTEASALRLIKLEEIIRGEKKQMIYGQRLIILLLFFLFLYLIKHINGETDYLTLICIGSIILGFYFLIKLEVKTTSDKIIALKEYLEIKISEIKYNK